MRKVAVITLLLITVVGLNCYGDDFSAQLSVLEQRADRVQSQVNQAKQQSDAALDQQLKALTGSVESLINQRVQLDAHIARLENQVDELKKTSAQNLSRQIKGYDQELSSIKQQMSSLVTAKKDTESKAVDTSVPVKPAPGK